MARTREQMIEMGKIARTNATKDRLRRESLAEGFVELRLANGWPCPTGKMVQDHVRGRDPSGASIEEAKGLDTNTVRRIIHKYYPDARTRSKPTPTPPDTRQVEIPIANVLPLPRDETKEAAFRYFQQLNERVANLQSDVTKINSLLLRVLAALGYAE